MEKKNEYCCYNEKIHFDMMNGLMEKLELMYEKLGVLKKYLKNYEKKYMKYFKLGK